MHETARETVRAGEIMTFIRIVGGSRRGHRLRVPAGGAVRPTGERVREAVFDVLGPVEGLTVLDLFAGTGAMGLEALSRGARRATLVESDPRISRVLRDNVHALRFVAEAKVVERGYEGALAEFSRAGSAFDLLFVDPPYRMLSQVMEVVRPRLPTLLASGGVVVVEGPLSDSAFDASDIMFQRRYGNTMVTMIMKGREDLGEESAVPRHV